MQSHRPALQLSNLSAGYGETVVIESLDFSLQAAESVSIIGRNGVGKSTLLASIMGHTDIHGGEINWRDRDISSAKPYQRVALGIGYVPQEREIFASLNVQENLAVAQRPGAWNNTRVFELFPQLYERRGNFGNQLSGGEQQMLAIGRALVGNPDLVLMDEPSEGLAPVIVDELQSAMQRLRQDESMSLILVEQNSRVALQFASRCLVMNRGRIVYDGSSEKLQNDEQLLTSLIGLESAQRPQQETD